jgi:hypothetical protein
VVHLKKAKFRSEEWGAPQYICIHGIGIIQKDFYDVIQDPAVKDILGDSPYRLAYDFAMIQCAWLMKQLEESFKEDRAKNRSNKPTREYVSFVCDEHEEHSVEANKAYRNLKLTNPNAAEYMATFSMADDKKCEVLQAADAAAFEVRRALNLSLGYFPGPLRKQVDLLEGKVMFLITYCAKQQLLDIAHSHKFGEPFKLDALMDARIDKNIKLIV